MNNEGSSNSPMSNLQARCDTRPSPSWQRFLLFDPLQFLRISTFDCGFDAPQV